ncbi:CinA family protein [Lentilactobacillus laojiaonis]|uniref:CinA family protein n=1 Tax=Lentilactobacillus laojiaonis TaxID=2883998 RepID=UPI001D0B603E|nr:CinA family protein [Lentilactobacillus laojiaonis]UDM31719.1 CinA family protein [Lentilactobacillus laojiaonis]
MNLSMNVVQLLTNKKLTITAAESLTGGAFQTAITSVSGASKIFYGGYVTYSNEAKHELLKIDNQIINKYGVVSKEIAMEMAKNTMNLMKTDLSISFTGVAGPESLEGNPPGTVWIGLAYKELLIANCYHFIGNREQVRKQSVDTGMQLIIKTLREQ